MPAALKAGFDFRAWNARADSEGRRSTSVLDCVAVVSSPVKKSAIAVRESGDTPLTSHMTRKKATSAVRKSAYAIFHVPILRRGAAGLLPGKRCEVVVAIAMRFSSHHSVRNGGSTKAWFMPVENKGWDLRQISMKWRRSISSVILVFARLVRILEKSTPRSLRRVQHRERT